MELKKMKNNEKFTENKRYVITLLRQNGKLTKRQLTSMGKMGWATVVKMINQLLEEGIVVSCGISETEKAKVGKHAISYTLVDNYPLAIGIDNELRTTRIVLINLLGEILAEEKYETPQSIDIEDSCKFFENSIKVFIEKNKVDMGVVKGIGIGKSGISFPSIYYPGHINTALKQREYLMSVFNIEVKIETNTRVYSVFEQWTSENFKYNDFFFVQIRKGVGTGIITKGNLYSGTHGLSGEISHIKVIQNGLPCRCGSVGCMETVVNEFFLYEQYRMLILKDNNWADGSNDEILRNGLSDLFTRAKKGEEAALNIVKSAAGYLGYSISMAIIVLDIPNIIVSGYFGPDGNVIEKYIEDEIRKQILPKMPFSVHYVPLEPDGFIQGAALLILKDYLYNVPHEGIVDDFQGK
jgi:glucokinase